RRQGMAFREVLVIQVREVLRAWLAGAGKRPAARRAGVDVKTAARYIGAAQAAGLARGGDESQLTDELLGQVVAAVRPARPAGHGPSWEALAERKAGITAWVKDGLTLVKIHELLERSGTAVPYRTLARFAAEECGYSSSSRQQVTVPVADGAPGEEVQLDFGYLGMISDGDRRRKLHALVFTAVLSRYCFVYLTFSQTTAAVIAGCEAAWAFYGGMFRVLVADDLKPVVDKAGRLEPRWNREWLEYAQARGLVCDPARVRSPQDKGRVENGVKFTQRSFFAGEDFNGIEDAQCRADDWCRIRAGMRVHGTTRQRPAEVFAQVEAPVLLPAPEHPYRVPAWSQAKVQRDFHVRAQNAFYSVPYRLAGQQVSVRADGALVKIYHRGQVIRTHAQQPAGGRASDAADFPPGTDIYARRDVDKLAAMAAARGKAIGIYAARILDTPLPWTRMRAVYALIGLARTYGSDPVEQACAAALELDVISVAKIKSIVEKGTGKQAAQAAARARQAGEAAAKVTAARFARDPREFATATGVRMQVLPGGPDASGA
ncbi:MAG TPA: IS21 family transposase, partial [Streptosporangiaceae bacterium]|nr:IS21 family transposase [Streptosporangiaceae bacterium]